MTVPVRLRSRLCALLLLPALTTPLLAQDPPAPADTTAHVQRLHPLEVVVTRGLRAIDRTPLAVSLLERGEIQGARATVGLEEALAIVPGVLVNNRYNFSLGSRIAIRGFGSRAAFGVRGVRILVDGVPLTMPDGQAALNNVDLGSAGRMEVIRGPAAALYGNAAGGVISITTEEPPQQPLGTEARVILGDYGTDELTNLRKTQIKIGGRTAQSSYLASFSHLELDGFREHSRTRNNHFNGKLRFELPGSGLLAVVLNTVDAPVAQSPGALPLDSVRLRPSMAWPRNVETRSGEAAEQAQLGVTYVQPLGTGQRLDVSVYGLRRELLNPLTFAVIDLNRRAGGARASYHGLFRLADRPLYLASGLDLEAMRDERREFNNVGGEPGPQQRRDQIDRVGSLGPFAQAQWLVHRAIELTVGLRYDAVAFRTDDRLLADGDQSGERTLSALSPMAGVLLAARPGLSLYATAATSFQTPTTTELINAPPRPGEACCPSGFNSDLEPQRALSLEVGARGWAGTRVHYDVALYTIDVEDELLPFQVAAAEGREFFRNAGESRHRGLELALRARLTQRLSADIAYTYSHFTFGDDGLADRDLEGNRLPGVPPHRLFARAAYRSDRVSLELQGENVDKFFTNDANTDTDPGYVTLDTRLALDVPVGRVRVQPFVGISNLLDERYNSSVVINGLGRRYYEPAPGRHFYLGLTLPYGKWGKEASADAGTRGRGDAGGHGGAESSGSGSPRPRVPVSPRPRVSTGALLAPGPARERPADRARDRKSECIWVCGGSVLWLRRC